jgi:hypothetical protein
MDKDDGGAAFPRNSVPATVTYDGNRSHHTMFVPAQDGMTLRDYFAAAAIPSLLSNDIEAIARSASKEETVGEFLAKQAYKMADAMLAERSK